MLSPEERRQLIRHGLKAIAEDSAYTTEMVLAARGADHRKACLQERSAEQLADSSPGR